MRIFATALAILGAAGVASAATIQVKKGTDIETIGAAVAVAQAGDTIIVNKGVYAEYVDVSGLDGLILKGKGAIWDGSSGGSPGSCLYGYASGVHVSGFTFRNGTNQVNLQGEGTVIEKCSFRGAGNFAVLLGDDTGAAGSRVSKCRFRSNYSGIQTYGSDVVVEKSTFFQLESTGLDLHGDGNTVQKNAFNTINTSTLTINGNTALVDSNRFQNGDSTFITVNGNGAVISRNKCYEVDSDGIYVSGSAAVITANQVTATSSYGVTAYGPDITVSGNRLFYCSSDCIYVSGPGAIVLQNTMGAFFSDGIDVYGDNAAVDGNVLSDGDNGCIYVYGNNFSITGNKVSRSGDNEGIYAGGSGGTTGGLVEGNTVFGTAEWGISANGNSITIRGNTVTSCGGMYTGGIYVSGSSFTLEDNTVKDAGGYGFRTEDGTTSTTFTGCTATGSTLDGFHVGTGSGVSLTNCSATGSGGEGLDNRALGTNMQGCTLKGNRIDVANQFNIGAGFSGDITMENTFVTGGADTLPEVDYLF